MTDFSAFVPNVHYELIPIKNLVSDQAYQRDISWRRVKEIAENFDLAQVNAVKISRRDGKNYVKDGQHTIEAVALVAGSRDAPVWCRVQDDLDYKREADIFAKQQRHTKPPSPYEIFNAHIEADNQTQVILKSLLESCGLKITHKPAYGCICAVSTLQSLFIKYGYEILDRALRLIVTAWEGDSQSLSSNMLKAVTRMVATFGDELNDEKFIQQTGSYTPREITRTAKERRQGSLGYAMVLLEYYNKRSKGGLSAYKLLGKEEAHNESV